jgi:hypothetical protein
MKIIKIKKRVYNPRWWQRLLFWKLYQVFEVSIPENWGEVDDTVFLELFQATLNKHDGDRALACFRAILPTSIKDEVHFISAYSLYRAVELMAFCQPRQVSDDGAWIYDETKLLNDPPVKDFLIKHGGFRGELRIIGTLGKDLDDITCRVFRDASAAYAELQSGKKEAAWSLLSMITGWHEEANYMAKWIKYPIPSFFVRYFGDSLEQIFFDINGISPTFFQKNKESIVSDGVNFGWDGVFLEVAKDGVFGTYEQVLNSRFHDVMLYSVKKYEDALMQMREMEKNESKNGNI